MGKKKERGGNFKKEISQAVLSYAYSPGENINSKIFILKNALVWKARYVVTPFENTFNFIIIHLSPLGGIPWWSNG